MNKNMKYWATGIIAAIVILAIAAFAAAGSRKKAPIPPAPTEMESSSQTGEQSSGSAESKNSMDHSGHGGSDAASDDDTNRYLQRQDEIMMDMMHDMENIPKTGNASIDFLNGMIPHHESAIEMADSYLEYGGSNEKLKKLEMYDNANGSFLIDTLVNYYMCGFNVGKTAEMMYVHRNSLQYRLKKIEEILEINLDDSMEYLDLVNCILVKRLMFH